jgi:hypothetical protein
MHIEEMYKKVCRHDSMVPVEAAQDQPHLPRDILVAVLILKK